MYNYTVTVEGFEYNQDLIVELNNLTGIDNRIILYYVDLLDRSAYKSTLNGIGCQPMYICRITYGSTEYQWANDEVQTGFVLDISNKVTLLHIQDPVRLHNLIIEEFHQVLSEFDRDMNLFNRIKAYLKDVQKELEYTDADMLDINNQEKTNNIVTRVLRKISPIELKQFMIIYNKYKEISKINSTMLSRISDYNKNMVTSAIKEQNKPYWFNTVLRYLIIYISPNKKFKIDNIKLDLAENYYLVSLTGTYKFKQYTFTLKPFKFVEYDQRCNQMYIEKELDRAILKCVKEN